MLKADDKQTVNLTPKRRLQRPHQLANSLFLSDEARLLGRHDLQRLGCDGSARGGPLAGPFRSDSARTRSGRGVDHREDERSTDAW